MYHLSSEAEIGTVHFLRLFFACPEIPDLLIAADMRLSLRKHIPLEYVPRLHKLIYCI